MITSPYPITSEFCYLAMVYIKDQSEAINLPPAFGVQMGLLNVAASLEAEYLHELADGMEIARLQMEHLTAARKQADMLAQMALQTEDTGRLNTILAAAKRIQERAEKIFWKMTKIEA